MKTILFVAAICALAACSSGGPVKTGPDTYYLTKKSAGCGFSGGEGSKAALLREANDFCAKQGKEIKTLEADAKNGVPFVRCASAEVQFRCVSAAGN
ncbi:hypothetical protein [Rhodanobacter thiooxydans]|uniref:hypothetical protein n=1 Tax=Rhodanobacter thiooxydans TaxID=416169 RepID=UPI00131F010F|nr:hypothetical protein [Rhodanobacter thiooxydans]